MFELGEDLLDGVQIGAAGWQKEQMRPGGADRLSDRRPLVTGEIVHHHNVSGVQCGDQFMVNVSGECFGIDRPVKDPGGVDAVMAQSRDKSHRIPVPVGGVALQTLPLGGPAPQRGHVGFRPGFINKDKPRGINPTLMAFPPIPEPRDIRALLLLGQRGFFYS